MNKLVEALKLLIELVRMRELAPLIGSIVAFSTGHAVLATVVAVSTVIGVCVAVWYRWRSRPPTVTQESTNSNSPQSAAFVANDDGVISLGNLKTYGVDNVARVTGRGTVEVENAEIRK